MATTRDPASAEAPPREGLPPCVRLSAFEDRMAVHHTHCGKPCVGHRATYSVGAAVIGGWESDDEHGFGPYAEGPWVLNVRTDDPSEAEAAWERAESWIRTGELP